MIARLRGELVATDGTEVVVDVQGVGYRVQATQRAQLAWRDDNPITVHVSTQVGEDHISLYGFASVDERNAFEVLLGVSGVGPKVGLACLDGLPLSDLRRAIETDDVVALSRIKGIGKKTAQRLALELKGKLPAAFEPDRARTSAPTPSPAHDPLALGLTRLGYNKAEIEIARTKLADAGVADDAPVAQRLRAALQLLYER